MRIGVLLGVFLSALCLAGQPEASARMSTDTVSIDLKPVPARPPGPVPYFGPRLVSHVDTTRLRDTLLGPWNLPSPFVLHFLHGAGFGPLTYAQWHSRRYLRSDTANGGHYHGNPNARSEAWYSNKGGVMQTIGTIGYFVVPALLPPKVQEAFDRQQNIYPPGGQESPYHRW